MNYSKSPEEYTRISQKLQLKQHLCFGGDQDSALAEIKTHSLPMHLLLKPASWEQGPG